MQNQSYRRDNSAELGRRRANKRVVYLNGAGTDISFHYRCFGFTLGSPIALDELAPGDGTGDVRIEVGPVPEILPNAHAAGPQVQATDSQVLLTIAGTGRYLINDGREIRIDPEPGATERRIRLFLLGSALGLLCHQRGLLVLHANAIISKGRAFAFAGQSGAGKSTLAAHFQRTGYAVLSDDVCSIGFDAVGEPFAWPGIPRLKLWGDAARWFDQDCAMLSPVVDGQDKFQLPLPSAPGAGKVALRRLYVLDRAAPGSGGTITRLAGTDAMEAVVSHTYRGQYLGAMGLGRAHFQRCSALLARIPVYRVSRVWGYDAFAAEAARIEAHIAGDLEEY
jgi:hypothetical protein